jgi:hypothetical protein
MGLLDRSGKFIDHFKIESVQHIRTVEYDPADMG